MGTITEHEAQRDFLDFATSYTDWASENPEDVFLPLGYRFDTWQLWIVCTGNHREQGGCRNPGIHIAIDAPDAAPFTVNLGEYTLTRSGTIEEAFESMSTAARAIQIEAGHAHILQHPHHFQCTLCLPIDGEVPL